MMLRVAAFALLASCVSATRQKKAVAQADLGAAYLKEGHLPDAVATLERAVKDDPHNWDAWQTLGLAYGASRAEDKALDAFERALKISPENGEVNANYGTYLLALGKLDEAIVRFEVAKQDITYRNTANVLNNLGYAFYAKGANDQAVTVLSDAIQRAPNQWQARLHRGLAYEAKGEPKLAASDFDAVIELSNGTVPEAYISGARVEFALGDPVTGCAYLDQVLTLTSNTSQIRPEQQRLAEDARAQYQAHCAGIEPGMPAP